MPGNPLLDLAAGRAGPAPDSAGAATILLHGRGRASAEMLVLAERLEIPGMSFVAPSAQGGSWYPESFLAPRERNEPHLRWALERIEADVRALQRTGIVRERIALLGFSQGACLATEYVYRSRCRWGGLAALTGGLLGPPGTEWPVEPQLAGTPVLLTDGNSDEWVPLQRVKETAEVFGVSRAVVDLRVYPGRSHVISDDEVHAARRLLVSLLSGAASR